MCITLFCTFFVVTADYDVKIPNFTFYGGRKQATISFSFYF